MKTRIILFVLGTALASSALVSCSAGGGANASVGGLGSASVSGSGTAKRN